MKIELSEKEYRDLVLVSELAGGIIGVLGDLMKDEEKNYKKISNRLEKLQDKILSYADDFSCSDLVEDFEGRKIIKEEFYDEVVYPIIKDNAEMETFDSLANSLAWRDFKEKFSQKELEEKAKENGGYFGVEIHDYEKKYWDEFEEYGYDRLRIVK